MDSYFLANLIISLHLSLIESCVRTIPPEEVYITSTPDNWPITEEPVITDKPITAAPVTNVPVTDAPVTDAPVTEAPVTDAPVTDAPVEPDPCAKCDAAAIQPTPTDPAVIYSIQGIEAPGECVAEIICERTDGKVCDTVGVSAITPTELDPIRITDLSSSNHSYNK